MNKPKKYSRIFFFPQAVIGARIRSVCVQRPLLILFQDEARFGRITFPKRCWAPLPLRPLVPQQAIREYVYVYGAFDPSSGISDTLILPDMYATTMTVFLEEEARRHPAQEILMVMDGAPCHRAGTLMIPGNMHLCVLPPYSPECNPAENMWDHLREKWFANRAFKNMPGLIRHLILSLQDLDSDPQRTKSITGWSWIMNTIRNV